VIDLKVLSQALNGQGRTDFGRQQIHEVLEEADLAHLLQIPEIVSDDARETVPRPDPVFGLVPREQRLGKSSERQ
jgi:hypothetical protein